MKKKKKLLEQFGSLKYFDKKIDSLFKVIFGNSNNKDVAISLVKAVLPEEEEIKNLTFHDLEIRTNSNFNPEKRGITVDINAEDIDNNKFYIIEMQIHEVPDLLGRAELSTSRIFDSLYTKNESVTLKKKIYSINFLYYDMFPEDKDYYHHIYPHEFNKKNVSIPFKDTVVIELKKFNKKFEETQFVESKINKEILEKFDESQINKELEKSDISQKDKELLLSEKKKRRIVERQLWFAFLSKINTLYKEPSSIDRSKYFSLKRKIKIKKKNDSQNQENVDKNQKKEDKMKEVVIYIENEISEELFKFLIKVGPIRKALELCVNLSENDIEKYVSDVDDHTGLLSQIDEKNKVIEEQRETIKEQRGKLDEKDKVIEEKDEIIEELQNIVNELKRDNNESNNNENNKKIKI